MNIQATTEKHWLAFYTKPKQEFKTADLFHLNYIEHFLPTISTIKQWHDRKKKIQEPLFKSYIFAYVNEAERQLAIRQESVVTCVNFSGKPSVIPDWQIDSLKKMLTESPEVFVTDGIEIGKHVKIMDGPFADVVGIVKEVNQEKWINVSIELLNRTVAVRLPREAVIKFVEN